MTLKEELIEQWERQFGGRTRPKPDRRGRMKVYVAGSYKFRAKIDHLVDMIKTDIPEFESTSTWIRQGEEDDELEKHGHQHFIDLDVADIERCDVFLLVNEPSVSVESTGKWVELGLAMALNKMIVVWGAAQDSLFLHGDTVVQIPDSVDSLIDGLVIINKVRKELHANRSIGSRPAYGSGGGTQERRNQARSEDLRLGIQQVEGGSLHGDVRTPPSGAQGLKSPQIRAGEATPPHGPSVVK